MARVLFCQPTLEPPGGGQAVAAHMLGALLRHGHDVTLLTAAPFDPVVIDQHFGTTLTALARDRVTTIETPNAVHALRRLQRFGVSFDLLRSAVLLRETRRREGDFDLVVSAHNEWPVGGPCVSYVHYPSRARPRPAADLRWFHAGPLLRAYHAAADALAGFTVDGVRRQHLLTNSAWTNDVIERTWGVRATVLPPVVDVGDVGDIGDAVTDDLSWDQRAPTFICAGRFAPAKRHDDVIAIVRGVRARGHDVRLLFLGHGSPGAEATLRAHAAREGFIDVDAGLDRTAYLRRLRGCRFGLHAMHEEHFGIAPAELTEAGCVTWGHRSGGVPEAIGDEALTFVDVDDAVDRIDATLRDPAALLRLRQQLGARRGRFSAARFERTFIDVVDAALTGR